MKIPESTRQWLRSCDIPYIRYQVDDFLSPEKKNKRDLVQDSFVRGHIEALKEWDTEILKRHDKPDLLIHRLALLADLGLETGDDPIVDQTVNKILDGMDENYFTRVWIEIPTVFGGSGKAGQEWVICDYPTILYALVKMGVKNEKVDASVRALTGLVKEDGFPCTGSIPKFHGPGPRDSMCPYANLISVKVLSLRSSDRKSPAARNAIQALLGHWSKRKEKKYFLFGMGTDFTKIKFPLVWYNLLHTLEALSRFEGVEKEPGFQEMLEILVSKADPEMRYRPESIYMPYKTEEFSHKKEPSRLITVFVYRILRRLGRLEV